MAKQGVTKIDIKQVLAQKAPKASRKIPGFIVDYLIRTVHQEELNDILTRYHDKEGVDFMRELIGYFDLTLNLVHEENIPTEGRYIFASNHPLGGVDGVALGAITQYLFGAGRLLGGETVGLQLQLQRGVGGRGGQQRRQDRRAYWGPHRHAHTGRRPRAFARPTASRRLP